MTSLAGQKTGAQATASFEFRTGMTPHLLQLSIAVGVATSFMVIQGLSVNQTWRGTHRGDMFFGLGAIILVGFLATLWKFMLGCAIELTPQHFVFKEADDELQIPWPQVTFHPSTGKWPMFERCMVSDIDGTSVELHRMFYPRYDDIVNQVVAITRRLDDV